MSSSVSAKLYVLRRSEGGRAASLQSGCNATLTWKGLETRVCVQLQCKALLPGEMGVACLTRRQQGALPTALADGQAVSLSVYGDLAAVGHIVGDDTIAEGDVLPATTGADDDPPRIVILVSILIGGLFCLIFARNVGALWQKLIGFAVSCAVALIWTVYSELRREAEEQTHDEPSDATKPD
ncbi:MAG: hypothetical protein Aurels2KO_21550 [Aureliella sp.]